MEKTKMVLCGLFLFGVFFWALPSTEAVTINVDCGAGGILQTAIDATAPGDIISVSGTCNENVVISPGKGGITLDGGGSAIINGPVNPLDPKNTVLVFGRGTKITGFTITGGDLDGIAVGRGGTATIDNNSVYGTGRHGITVFDNSFAIIINNTIGDAVDPIPEYGIVVTENSTARIGFFAFYDTVAQPNTIQNNGRSGVLVIRSSSAVIVGNMIRGNAEDGVTVVRVSHADISDNTINANRRNGILVSQNSGVNLGNDTGTTMFDLPNSTAVTAKNTMKGLLCSIGAYADGRRGTLRGVLGVASYTTACFNSTIP